MALFEGKEERLNPLIFLHVCQMLDLDYMMGNKLKEMWFRHYVWIIPVLAFLCGIIILVTLNVEKHIRPIATIIGIALSAIYFVQKQKLEEIKLFKQLFCCGGGSDLGN